VNWNLLIGVALQLVQVQVEGMAFFRDDISRSFSNNQQLQQFVLPGVTPTGKVLGQGSYGMVEEVRRSNYSQINT
jgi:hypothetical protein